MFILWFSSSRTAKPQGMEALHTEHHPRQPRVAPKKQKYSNKITNPKQQQNLRTPSECKAPKS